MNTALEAGRLAVADLVAAALEVRAERTAVVALVAVVLAVRDVVRLVAVVLVAVEVVAVWPLGLMLSWQPSSPPRSSRPIPLPVPTGCFEPPETPLSLSAARVNRLTLCITKYQTGSTIATQDSPSHRRYSTEIVTTAEAIEPSWLREIWICGIDPAPKAERCAERAFRRSCITA